VADCFNVRGLPANFAGRKQDGKPTGRGNLPANPSNCSGKSFAPEPKRTESKEINLRPLTRPSSVSCGKSANAKPSTPQQRRFAIIRSLTNAASAILAQKPNCQIGDLTEELKQWAAANGVPYFDAWPGAATPIEQAITNAIERRKSA